MTTTAAPRAQPGFVPMPRATLAPRPPAAASGARGAPAVDVRDFSFAYGTRQVLRNLTFGIERKAVTAIIGPSGCGKSTFLRSINRLNDLIPGVRHTGDILVEGTSVFSHGTDLVALRQRVGMVFQRPNPFPKSIFDNVAYGPALNRLVAKRDLPDLVERCLRQAALWDEVKDRLRESATSLSGGQQQRLCIARAIATRPPVLLLDEPTASLDPISTQKVEELVYELRREMTVVVVTHNMQQAARVSDRTAFMLAGELVEVAPTSVLFTSPADARTEAYITGRFG
jgi:phosphate transport system ATP-binding protein